MAVFNPFNPLKDVTLKFTEEKLEEIIQYFDRHAKPILVINEDPPIPAITIEHFVKFLNLRKFDRRTFAYPTYARVMNYAESLLAEKTRVFSRDQVIYILNDLITEPQIKNEVLKAFALFDTEKRSFLELDDLKSIVTTYGDTFDEAECREFLRDANVRGDGNIFYEKFVESLFSIAPELYDMKTELLYEDPKEDPTLPPEEIEAEEEEKDEEKPPPPPPQPPPPPAKPAAPAAKGKGKKGK